MILFTFEAEQLLSTVLEVITQVIISPCSMLLLEDLYVMYEQ